MICVILRGVVYARFTNGVFNVVRLTVALDRTIVANRPVLTGTVLMFGLLSQSCPDRAVQTGGMAHTKVWSHAGVWHPRVQ